MLRDEEKSSSKPSAKATPAAKPKKTAKAETGSKPAKATATKTTASAKTVSSKPKKAKGIDTDLRHKLINETAHFLAEKRCCGASEMDDWLFAEQLVDGVSGALR